MSKLSFCITCKNRFPQIRQTLKKNLNDNRLFKNVIEFVLVDFGSTDGLLEWICLNFKNDLKSGYLKYYYTEELLHWHASIAKNTSHLLASNEILVNLDCDNYTGYCGGRFVIQQFMRYNEKIVLHQFSKTQFDGSYGRIAVDRNSFLSLQGYDEEFEPMAVQDEDLLRRLNVFGLRYVLQPNEKYNKAIRNTKEEGLLYTNSKLSYMEMLKKNEELSAINIANKKLIANPNGWGIRKNIYDISGRLVKF